MLFELGKEGNSNFFKKNTFLIALQKFKDGKIIAYYAYDQIEIKTEA